MLDEASKMSGLTRKQYSDWERIECMETNTKDNSGGSLSRRKKERTELTDRADRESSANRRDRQRAADEERKKKDAQDKRKIDQQLKADAEKEGWEKATRLEKETENIGEQ